MVPLTRMSKLLRSQTKINEKKTVLLSLNSVFIST